MPTDEDWLTRGSLALLSDFRADFPLFEPVNLIELSASPKLARSLLESLRDHPKFRLSSDDGQISVSIAETGIGVVVKKPYPGWEGFRHRVAQVWDVVSNVAAPTSLTLATARYVNAIPRTPSELAVSKWLRPSDFLPQAAISSSGAASFRISSPISDDETIVVRFKADAPQEDTVAPEIELDIESEWRGVVEVETSSVLERLDSLHEHVWQVFNALRTEHLNAYMNGGS